MVEKMLLNDTWDSFSGDQMAVINPLNNSLESQVFKMELSNLANDDFLSNMTESNASVFNSTDNSIHLQHSFQVPNSTFNNIHSYNLDKNFIELSNLDKSGNSDNSEITVLDMSGDASPGVSADKIVINSLPLRPLQTQNSDNKHVRRRRRKTSNNQLHYRKEKCVKRTSDFESVNNKRHLRRMNSELHMHKIRLLNSQNMKISNSLVSNDHNNVHKEMPSTCNSNNDNDLDYLFKDTMPSTCNSDYLFKDTMPSTCNSKNDNYLDYLLNDIYANVDNKSTSSLDMHNVQIDNQSITNVSIDHNMNEDSSDDNFGLEDFSTPLKLHRAEEDNDVIAIDEDDVIISDGEDNDLNTDAENNTNFVSYKSALSGEYDEHPSHVVETTSMSYISMPDIIYKPKLLEDDNFPSGMSSLQLESIIYASQAHTNKLPNGERAGFLIGDGVGMGKGRIIAGTVKENWLNGRCKAIWVTVSNDLKVDARRDLNDIKAENIPIMSITSIPYDKKISDCFPEGVLFCTYASLMGTRKNCTAVSEHTYDNRLTQIIEWCGSDFDGLLIFDECHRASNFKKQLKRHTTKSSVGSQVYKLQSELADARVLYVSATMASEPADFCYMTRLGLWGLNLPFKNVANFLEFASDLNMMELIAMDLKQRGLYLARKLSFHGVEYDISEVDLSPEFKQLYNESCYLFKLLLSNKIKKEDKAFFWGSHLRFFKYLCIASKVSHLVDLTKRYIDDGYSVVIGLQMTGESLKEQFDSSNIDNHISPAKGVLESLFTKSPYLFSPKAVALMETLLPKLPKNPLDEIIENLGGPEKVAEMTGRKQRNRTTQPQNKQSKKIGNADDINLKEREAFMSGDKYVAIISEAASTGISLQSDRRVKNTRRRLHICLELPWSADRALQQMGRTHRSNQVIPPKYLILMTKLAGEHRFAFSLAQRLKMLGALTQGDRQVQEGSVLTKFGLNQPYADETVKKLFTLAERHSNLITPRGYKSKDFCSKLVKTLKAGDVISDNYKFTRFVNRLLGLPINIQEVIFEIFQHLYQINIKNAIKNNELKDGITSIEVKSVQELDKYEIVKQGVTCKERTDFQFLRLEVGLNWDEAISLCNKNVLDSNNHSLNSVDTTAIGSEGFYLKKGRSWRKSIILAIKNKKYSDNKDSFYDIYAPGYDGNIEILREDKLKRMYKPISYNDAEANWTNQYELLKHHCSHYLTKNKVCEETCNTGKTSQERYILTGSIVNVVAEFKKSSNVQLIRIINKNITTIGIEVPKRLFDKIFSYFKSHNPDIKDRANPSTTTNNTLPMNGGSFHEASGPSFEMENMGISEESILDMLVSLTGDNSNSFLEYQDIQEYLHRS